MKKQIIQLLTLSLLITLLTGCNKKDQNESQIISSNQSEEIIEEKQEEPIQEQESETNQEQTPEVVQEENVETQAPTVQEPTPSTSNYVVIGNTNRTVIIDAGHGGADPGCSANGVNEKDVTLQYAISVGNYLTSQGIQVIYTRDGDYELEKSSYSYNGSSLTNDLTARSKLGLTHNAALYCSFHIDSNDENTHGFSCFYNPQYSDSLDLANLILTHLEALGYAPNRGLLDGTRLRSIRGNSTISIMVELGFIQSSDLTYLLANVDLVAKACGDAIIEKLNKGWNEAGREIVPDLADY